MRNLYSITAVIDEVPKAAFIIARNNDEATGKATAALPPNGRITHITFVCEANPRTLKRNQLFKFLPVSDQINFTCENLLRTIWAMSEAVNSLRKSIAAIHDIVINQFGMVQFSFSVSVPDQNGSTTQYHNCSGREASNITVSSKSCRNDKCDFSRCNPLGSLEEHLGNFARKNRTTRKSFGFV